ncbi:hypothetical protein pb186bvf_008404 [Paramecium bursaria]
MLLQTLKSTLKFYLIIHSIVSLFSLIICFEDIDHFNIVCPRMSNDFKFLANSLTKPYKPELVDYIVVKILELDFHIINTFIFSGLLVLFFIPIYNIYYLSVNTPQSIQRIVRFFFKAFILFVLISWTIIYFKKSSGVGFDRLMRALQFLFSDPTNFDAHQNGVLEFIQKRRDEILEWYF